MLPPIGLGILVLVVLFAVVFSRWFTRPVRQLSAGAREMAEGNYDVHVDVRRKDELGLLAQEFNHMAGEVKRSAQLERDILANVSHDLRTPLTLIKGYAETVRDITGDDAERRAEQCNIIVDETDRLSALVNSVMELSKVSSGAEKPNLVTFDMSQLCFEVAGRYDAVCDQNGWTLQLEADHECIVQADPDMMERVLHNLLGNATHHMGQDGIRCLPAAAAVRWRTTAPVSCRRTCPTCSTGTTAPARIRARSGPGWGCPSPRPFCSSTASPLASTASPATARPSGSRCRTPAPAKRSDPAGSSACSRPCGAV